MHAGGPPLHIYLLPQQLDKTVFQATTVFFFFAVNWLKPGRCAYVGQLDGPNLLTSLILLAVGLSGIVLGAYLHHRINEAAFYRIIYAALAALGIQRVHASWVAA